MKTFSAPPWPRAILGFLIVPIVAAIVFTATLMAAGVEGSQPGPFVIVFCIHVGYPVAFVLGVPTYIILLRRRWDGWAAYLAAGAALSIAACCWYISASSEATFSKLLKELADIRLLSALIVGGMIGALCFWLIVRPDRANGDPQPAL